MSGHAPWGGSSLPDESISMYHVAPIDVLMLSIIVLFLGMYLTRKIRFLHRYHIPPAVTGGLIISVLVAMIHAWADLQITFDMRIRDVLLLAFFSTIGLSAKFRFLVAGGKALIILIFLAGIFLIIQDATGVLAAILFDAHPGYGLFAGSVSLAGGHGTAIAWGDVAKDAGLEKAGEIGIAFATFGLIAGGLIGGPIAGWLIDKHKLEPAPTGDTPAMETAAADREMESESRLPPIKDVLGTILLIAICVEFGSVVNRFLFEHEVVLPGFLTSLLVGVLLTNLADVSKFRIHRVALNRASELSLQLFLSMSLMSMQLLVVADTIGTILIVMFVQSLVITVFAVFIVFRFMGRDYDAAVICAGFMGMGLGATPVAIANMSAITSYYGPSPKAFLIVPLIGAFFIDILNALVIKLFLGGITNFLT